MAWIIDALLLAIAALVAAWREGRMTLPGVIRILGGCLAIVAGLLIGPSLLVGTTTFAVVRAHEAATRRDLWAALEAAAAGLAAAVLAARLRSGLDSPERVAAGVVLALAGYALIVWGMALGQTEPRAEPGAEEAEA